MKVSAEADAAKNVVRSSNLNVIPHEYSKAGGIFHWLDSGIPRDTGERRDHIKEGMVGDLTLLGRSASVANNGQHRILFCLQKFYIFHLVRALKILPYSQFMLRFSHTVIFVFIAVLLCGCGEEERLSMMPDHYAVLDGPPPPVSEKMPAAAIVILEMIEVDGRMLNDWTLEHSLDPTRATPLRREAQEWIRRDKARIIETAAIHVQNKKRAKTSSVREVIYPSEYRYPIKTTVVTTTDTKKKLKDKTRTTKETTEEVIKGVAATGHIFKMREVGTILEVGATIDPAGDTIKIDLASELVHYFENIEWQAMREDDIEKFSSPVFEKNAYQTSFTLQNGIFGLIGSGTLPEPIRSGNLRDSILLVFVRADSNQSKP